MACIPYMGSKQKLAKRILGYILMKNPNCKYFYDLFGGGGAITFEAIQRQQIHQVFYNEINTGVVELLRKIIRDGITDEFYNWVDRDTFFKHRLDKTWFGGLLQTVWSFGNRGRTYLYGKNRELIKKAFHYVTIFNDFQYFEKLYDCEYLPVILQKYNIDNKVKFLDLYKSQYIIGGGRKEHLRVVNWIQNNWYKKIYIYNKVDSCISALQHLNNIEKLERLNNFERLQRLEHLSNLSYEEVKIDTPSDETVIYCDPPYEGKEKYLHSIDYDSFYKWVKESKYKVYSSGYDNVPLYECCSWEHRSIFSSTNNSKIVLEKLYCNRVENKCNFIKEMNIPMEVITAYENL